MRDLLIDILTAAGQSEESAIELAELLALHYPEHTQVLLDYTTPTPEGEASS